MPRRFAVHGHRGARAARPENTLPAFEYAIAAGVDFIEMDVAATRDDAVVVTHDLRRNPLLCDSPGGPDAIRELTLAEVRRWDCGSRRHPDFPAQETRPGARIPTLDEVLALAPRGGFGFNIEIKSEPEYPDLAPPPRQFAALVLACIRRHGLEARVIVQSFDFRVLEAMRELAPEVCLAALFENRNGDFVSTAGRAGTRIAAPEHTLVTAERVEAAHAAGIQVIAWTANAPAEWERLAGAGVDAIITDDPERLIAWREAFSAHRR